MGNYDERRMKETKNTLIKIIESRVILSNTLAADNGSKHSREEGVGDIFRFMRDVVLNIPGLAKIKQLVLDLLIRFEFDEIVIEKFNKACEQPVVREVNKDLKRKRPTLINEEDKKLYKQEKKGMDNYVKKKELGFKNVLEKINNPGKNNTAVNHRPTMVNANNFKPVNDIVKVEEPSAINLVIENSNVISNTQNVSIGTRSNVVTEPSNKLGCVSSDQKSTGLYSHAYTYLTTSNNKNLEPKEQKRAGRGINQICTSMYPNRQIIVNTGVRKKSKKLGDGNIILKILGRCAEQANKPNIPLIQVNQVSQNNIRDAVRDGFYQGHKPTEGQEENTPTNSNMSNSSLYSEHIKYSKRRNKSPQVDYGTKYKNILFKRTDISRPKPNINDKSSARSLLSNFSDDEILCKGTPRQDDDGFKFNKKSPTQQEKAELLNRLLKQK
jgi:hypothetical protein